MKTGKIIGFFGIFTLFFATFCIYGVYAFLPNKDVSSTDVCSYSVSGSIANGSAYGDNNNWHDVPCNTNLSFSGLGIPDGTYSISLKGFDQNSLGSDKTFSDGTNTSKTNKSAVQTYGIYKVDTTPIKCTLKEIRFKAGASNNQYYSSGSFYYKQTGGAGKFELVIEADEITSGTNTSGVQKIEFPTILGATPATQSFSSSTWTGKVVVTGLYDWSGNHTDNFDILNNSTKNFCIDFAGNQSPLTSDASTKVVFEDGNHTIVGLPSLILSPDGTVPTVGGTALTNLTNGFSYQSGNDGLGAYLNIYDASTTNAKYFAALDNRKIIIPQFQDNESGLKSFEINIEKATNSSQVDTYTRTGSTKDTKLTTFSNTGITHDFSIAKLGDDLLSSNGYRAYNWDIQTLNLAGTNAITDFICDMVGNCLSVPTPDFRVVANVAIIAGNTSISDTTTKGTKHNLNNVYDGSDSSMRSNLSDTHTSIVMFRDKYGNEVLPVSGIKDVALTVKFDNTMGCDQLYGSGVGDCIDFLFKNGTTVLGGNIHSAAETKNFLFTLTNAPQFAGDLSIELKSAIPTKNEYKTLANELIYGSLTAKLELKNLGLQTVQKSTYSGVGENPNLEMAGAGNQPSYKWNPIINFNKIDNIYPLVEGQEKNLLTANTVHDKTGLPGYHLETHFGTNNFFLRFQDIYLAAGKIGANTIDNYTVYSGSLVSGNGFMNYSASDTLKFTPKTLGGISGTSTNVAFYSTLDYVLGSKSANIPSLQTGFGSYGMHEASDFSDASKYAPTSKVTLAEVDIRGISQTRNTKGEAGVTTDNKFMDTSSITLLDLKTDINKNVTTLLAGVDRNTGKVSGGTYVLASLTTFPNSSTTGKNLQSGQVLYFKDTDVTLNCGAVCEVSGKKTLIIENGNLLIKSDMKYDTTDSSILGIILVGNKANGSKSQVRIPENITNGVGIIYSEGPIISVKPDGSPMYDGTNPSNTSLVNQLYWRGSFATRNTVGGSIKDAKGVCPYGTPDYKISSCTIQKAQGYDLIYLRRYARVDKTFYTTISGDPMGDAKIPLNIDQVPVKTAGGDSFAVSTGTKTSGTLPKPAKNNLNAPLILEYDSQIQTNPPLGFTK